MKTIEISKSTIPTFLLFLYIISLPRLYISIGLVKFVLNIFKFYLLGLVIAFFVCLVIGAIWLGWRALRRADKTVKERQGALYDAIMMSMVSIPVLAFAFMAILIVLNA